MDCKMPVMDGGEAIEILKKQIATKAIPIIALSASSREVIEEQNSAVFFDDFLMKPIVAAELLELLKKYLKFHINSTSTFIEPENNIEFKFILTKAQIDQLPHIIYILENKYVPTYNQVGKKQVIGQIKAFGDQLLLLGEEQMNPIISDFGRELSAYANNFEISKMMKKLKSFPEIINKFKKLIQE